MRVILYPYGGLANRMRVIDSTVNMCRSCDCLSIIWYQDWGMKCGWNDLFLPVKFIYDRQMSKTMRRIFKYYQKNLVIKFLLLILYKLHILYFCDMENASKIDEIRKNWGKYLYCIIRSWEAYYPQSQFHNELFRLKDQHRLDAELSKINKNTIGVHIRRTDNISSIEHSPISLFEERMNNELEKNPLTDFYLCSDDQSVKEHFQTGIWKDKVTIPNGLLDRGSKDGIVQAACEMYALSTTTKILGSYWSSFGEIAARLGNIEIEICTISPKS